jgi:dephospho-CoA kinase
MTKKLTRIGLTGGIGSGKSRVAAIFEKAGITVVNLDQVGRELTDEDPAVIKAIAGICGSQVLAGGKLDRTKVREAIFAHPEARTAIERLLHPRIWKEFERRADAAAKAGKKLVICEAALLVEQEIHKLLDGLVLVTAPEEVRKQRVMERDRIPALLVEKMMRAQLEDEKKHHSATVVIENRGSIADLTVRVGELLDEWRTQGLI